MTEQLFNFVLKLKTNGKFESEVDTRVFEKSEQEKYYFIKLEKMYLGYITFPFKINYEDEKLYTRFAIMAPQNYVTNKRNKYVSYISVEDKYPLETEEEANKTRYLLAEEQEMVSSPLSFCNRVNDLIHQFIFVANNQLYKELYYPSFSVLNGELICEYFKADGTKKDPDNNLDGLLLQSYVVGFDKNLFYLIGKYFQYEWGGRLIEGGTDVYDNYYFVYPYNTETKIIATHQTEDFFHQEKTLYVEVSRAIEPTFTKSDDGYNYLEIPFRDDKGIHEINRYILIASNATIEENSITPHSTKCMIKNSPHFIPDQDNRIIITARLLYTIDYFDNFRLFSVKVGNSYTEEEYEQLTFKKLVAITARNVYVENNYVHQLLEDLNNRLLNHFRTMDNMSTDNIAQLVKNIYDIINQSQQITELGPPSKKISKIEFN